MNGLPQTPSDDDLLRLMLAGDEPAFTMLYRRRQGAIYRFALQMTGSESVAEDIVQEAFMTLMSEAEKYDPVRGTVGAFLYGIARNHVLRRLQRDRSYVSLNAEEAEESATFSSAEMIAREDPFGELTRAETIKAVRRAVLALPAHYREAVVLCDLEEMSYEEAASALGCAIGTVRSRLHRARALLMRKLQPGAKSSGAEEAVEGARCFA